VYFFFLERHNINVEVRNTTCKSKPTENGKIGVSELRNSWTDCDKIHLTRWLCQRYQPACQNPKRSP